MLSNSHGILDLKLSSPPTPIISLWEIAEDQPPAEREFFMKKKIMKFWYSQISLHFLPIFFTFVKTIQRPDEVLTVK